MNRETDNSIVQDAEATLRLVASLPAPAGLEDRVRAALASAAQKHKSGRVLAWPAGSGGAGNAWLRSAAAAAVVFVIAGGGWSVYSRVQPWQPVRVTPLPMSGGAQGGFGGAGAMRTPQTLNGPVITHAVKGAPVKPEKKDTAATPPVKKKGVPDKR